MTRIVVHNRLPAPRRTRDQILSGGPLAMTRMPDGTMSSVAQPCSVVGDDIGSAIENAREGIRSQIGDAPLSETKINQIAKSLSSYGSIGEVRRMCAENEVSKSDENKIVEIWKTKYRPTTKDSYVTNFWTTNADPYFNAMQAGGAITWKGCPARVINVVRAERSGMAGFEVFVECSTRDANTRDWNAFPSYTLKELKSWLDDPNRSDEVKAKARKEIAEREAGPSTQRVTPQIGGGKPSPKIGRM